MRNERVGADSTFICANDGRTAVQRLRLMVTLTIFVVVPVLVFVFTVTVALQVPYVAKVSTPRTIRHTRAEEELTLDDSVEPFGTVTRVRERIVELVSRDAVVVSDLFETVVPGVTTGAAIGPVEAAGAVIVGAGAVVGVVVCSTTGAVVVGGAVTGGTVEGGTVVAGGAVVG
ncbi:MAG: hypothetical protein ACO28P_09705, partial [Ilumatobacteraceae bacterium]